MIFWDTSALVKCYFKGETAHERAWNLLLGKEGRLASVLLRVEAASGLVRKHLPSRRRAEAALSVLSEHLGWVGLIGLDDSQVERATELVRKHALRGADAIHLAAAVQMARDLGTMRLRFVTADGEQAKAARAEGLRVIELAR